MKTKSFAAVRSPAFVSKGMRLVVFCERPADASALDLLSGIPAVPEMELHVVVGSDRRGGQRPTVRVLRHDSGFSASGDRWARRETKAAQDLLSRCGPGNTHEVLARYCAKIDANLVIVTAGAADRAAPWGPASLAERLSWHFPVLAIPAESTAAAIETGRPIRWLVPLDGSPSAEAILDPLAFVAHWLPSDITLLQPLEYARLWQNRVVRKQPASIARLGPSILDSSEYLAGIAGSRFANSPTRVCCTTEADAVRSIIRLANSSAIDAVAMGLSNRWRITRMLAAELNEKLLRRVRKPILLFGSTSR
jgi:nucleotide-binding universal stress UspA family protein